VTTVDPPHRSRRRGPTATSAFGVSRRESHDASAFYERFGRPEVSDDDTVAAPAAVDAIWCGDARDMDRFGQIADGSVALMVTSPPYFAGKEYEEALGQGHIPATFGAYLQMLEDVLAECRRKLEPGGRLAVNVANLGRKPYRSLAADVIDILQRRLGLLLRGEIVWVKSRGASGSCAWGTYQRPGNPVLRDLTERVIVASKGRFDRAVPAGERARRGLPSEGSLFMDEFMDATTDVWEIPAESATRVGHPAPFPVELPRRLIDLYTYRGDLVLDPFMGSGSTAVAAARTGRHFVGFDTDPAYVAAALARVEAERAAPAAAGSAGGRGSRAVRRAAAEAERGSVRVPMRAVVPPGRGRSAAATDGPGDVVAAGAGDSTDGDGADPADIALVAGAVRQGRKARDLAADALAAAGFTQVQGDVRFPELGVEVSFAAVDAAGRPWLFEVCGAFSATRPGLRRAETLFRTLGKAGVLRAGGPGMGPLVLLTTDLPAAGTPGARALAAVTGAGHPVHAVVELPAAAAVAALRALAHAPREGASDADAVAGPPIAGADAGPAPRRPRAAAIATARPEARAAARRSPKGR
jgi:DNA modification methylase